MRLNSHFHLAGKHATLSASKYHWIRDSDEKFQERMVTQIAAMKGTQLHELAANLIKMKIKLPRNRTTMSLYVNDAIGFRMTPEVILKYSDNAFGTADAFSFRDNFLRIFDLKTGVSKTSADQLKIYAAYFFLEYGAELGVSPTTVEMEFRIYQNDEVRIYDVDADEILEIMDKVVRFNLMIERMKALAFE